MLETHRHVNRAPPDDVDNLGVDIDGSSRYLLVLTAWLKLSQTNLVSSKLVSQSVVDL